jgi:hypothetical protein
VIAARRIVSALSQLLLRSTVVLSEGLDTVSDMNTTPSAERPHEHRAVTTYLLRRRSGVPYEVERTVCAACRRVLAERPLRRAAA